MARAKVEEESACKCNEEEGRGGRISEGPDPSRAGPLDDKAGEEEGEEGEEEEEEEVKEEEVKEEGGGGPQSDAPDERLLLPLMSPGWWFNRDPWNKEEKAELMASGLSDVDAAPRPVLPSPPA